VFMTRAFMACCQVVVAITCSRYCTTIATCLCFRSYTSMTQWHREWHRAMSLNLKPRSWCTFLSALWPAACRSNSLLASIDASTCITMEKVMLQHTQCFCKKTDAHGWHAPSQAAPCSIAISSLSNKAVPLKFRASVIKQHPA
jgi:hypothetical protein